MFIWSVCLSSVNQCRTNKQRLNTKINHSNTLCSECLPLILGIFQRFQLILRSSKENWSSFCSQTQRVEQAEKSKNKNKDMYYCIKRRKTWEVIWMYSIFFNVRSRAMVFFSSSVKWENIYSLKGGELLGYFALVCSYCLGKHLFRHTVYVLIILTLKQFMRTSYATDLS